ncbi:hypothetical protein MYO4S_00245 [Serratia phage 4S]|nr:hypothetical protein MYO4S_00245 [Serratia phage 4S]
MSMQMPRVVDLTENLKCRLEDHGIEVVICKDDTFERVSKVNGEHQVNIHSFVPRTAANLDEIVKWYTHSAVEVKFVVLRSAYGVPAIASAQQPDLSYYVRYEAKPFGENQ